MNTGKSGSTKANYIRQKQNRIMEQKSGPTVGENKSIEDAYQPLKTSGVVPEKKWFSRFYETISVVMGIVAFIGIISTFSIWVSTLQYDLGKAKDDITTHEKKLDEVSVKLTNSLFSDALNSNEILHIKKNQDSVEKTIYKIQEKVEKLSEEKYRVKN